MSVSTLMGNLLAIGVAELTLSPALVAANTTAEQTFTFPGIRLRDMIVGISKATAQAGLGIVNYRVSATDTLAITFSNNTASGITPTAAEVYRVAYARPEAPMTGVVI